MASANQIYFTIENVKRIQPKESWSFLGWQDPEAGPGVAVKEAKAALIPSGFNFRELSKGSQHCPREKRPQASLE